MNYHTPITQDIEVALPTFMIHNGELVCPEKLFKKQQYPSLPSDMVKITGINGQATLIPLHKLANVSPMDV